MNVAALIVAAGRGTRADSGSPVPKQYRELGGRPVLAQVVMAFAAHQRFSAIQVVIHPEDRARYDECCAGLPAPLRPPVHGGAKRQDSVRAGLHALASASPELVLIHDAARALIGREVISRVLAALGTHDGAIAALPVVDTLKRSAADGTVEGTVARDSLWRAQTPQGFRFARILAAHHAALAAGRDDFTDDAGIAEWAGLRVALVDGSERNLKLTDQEDFALAERLIKAPPEACEARTGSGFDVHRFREGDHVWLCGVRIDHDRGLEGHSDADVGLHALTDAILGAIADGDIGQHFPPTDARWAGASSHVFLRDAGRRVGERGGRIVNVDVTVLCEAPRISPHRDAMRRAVADILQIGIDRVSVKATTTERLGFTGRREGIAAMASATVLLPACNRGD
ncbi:MAG: bifunctional 2-C-methyl-D-erythritol 4-phosphate cytidylyltransferase/2-C-methyl-D-erythritol 2,4-cyclodiphosphate synthase [Hyphomicrobiaceae bacterium]|nr:bifunctional 2-C-methyl-D-erythritol 4-phosphate cytidylyltransferase/2-C-methyl-D-erythritol 2,4-cyclodiphosphate synthase [Hyphomicrobiaceae bacterium]